MIPMSAVNSEKRRLPKACTACRISKVKCEGDKPCLRCRNGGIECQFFRQPIDPTLEKLNDVAKNLGFLSDRFDAVQQSVAGILPVVDSMKNHVQKHNSIPDDTQETTTSGHLISLSGSLAFNTPREPYRRQFSPYEASQLNSSYNDSPSQSFCDPFVQSDLTEGNIDFLSSRKRKRSDFEVCKNTTTVDVVTRGLISVEEALQYFCAFFDGCDKFVPVFDPNYDTFDSVRERSGILFDIICTVGCRTEHGTASRQFQSLNKELNSKVCDVVFRDAPRSIETIQALLVVASYTEKGFLLTSLAMRMALQLGLPKLYKELIEQVLDADNLPSLKINSSTAESEDNSGRLLLFRSVRIFLGTFVLDHIFSLDTGKAPSIQGRHTMRRCRVLAKHPLRSPLDLRLLAQVELNAIRAQIHMNLAGAVNLSDQHLGDIIQDARIDLKVWFHDWLNIIETSSTHEDEKPVLLINLQIQKDWGEMMMLCKALQATGIENIAAMSDEQSSIINLLKESAQRHLKTITSSPDHYLANFRYSMDFVWAKCAFSVLLLLKLARILPGTTNMSQFLTDAKILIRELSKANGSNNIYFRILSLSVEKCERAWQAHLDQSNIGLTTEAVPFHENQAAEIDFQSYVPKEFVFEWDFPGLTFCYIPFDFQDMFLDFDTDFVSF